MARFGFVGPSYKSEAVNADCQSCRNWYAEVLESGDAASAMALYPSPGMQLFAPLTGTKVRGMYEWNGRCFVVTDRFYEVFSNGTSTGYSFLPDDGLPVTMEANSASQLLICAAGQIWLFPLVTPLTAAIVSTHGTKADIGPGPGGGRAVLSVTFASMPFSVGQTIYLSGLTTETWLNGQSMTIYQIVGNVAYSVNGSWVYLPIPPAPQFPYGPSTDSGTGATAITTQVTTGIIGPVASIAFVDGFFLALLQNTPEVQYSNPEDGMTWDPLNVFQVSEFSENVLAMGVLRREPWLLSGRHTLVYFDSGDPLNLFQPNPSGFIETGIVAQWSLTKLANSLFWIAADSRGLGVAVAATGYAPQRISTHAIEREWAGYSTMSDAIAYGMQINGHAFWHVYFPTANKSWRYDVTTNQWSEVTFLHADGTETAHRSRCHTEAFGKHLVGDTQTGNIYWLDKSLLYDDLLDAPKNLIRRSRRAPHITNELEWEFHHRLRVHMETGLGPIPPLPGMATGVPLIVLEDSSGIQWQVTIADNGTAQTASLGAGTTPPATYIFPDIAEIDTPGVPPAWYQLGIAVGGSPLILTLVNAMGGGSINRLFMMTQPSGLQTSLSVQYADIVIDTPTAPTREPQVMLRWSDDGGHSWSNEYMKGAGMSGEFKRRVEWRRLGRSRDRVYEIAVTDPIPWRIVDAYLSSTPSNQPIPRYATQLAKMA